MRPNILFSSLVFRCLVRAAVVAAVFVLLAAVDAQALVVKDARVSGGVLGISGVQAVPFAQITWEGSGVTPAHKRGSFSFSTTAVPTDCVGTLTDGSATISVVLSGCLNGGSVLIATGQTTSYAPGDDGALRLGLQLSYLDNRNGTVTDNNTGFMWEKKTDQNVNENYTWQGALDYVTALNSMNGGAGYAGYNDWRLPNIRELLSIVDYSHSNPSVDPIFGPTTGALVYAAYWSSTSWVGYLPANNAWAVEFADSFSNPVGVLPFAKAGFLRVRAVRGGR